MIGFASLVGVNVTGCNRRERDPSFNLSNGRTAGQTLLWITEGTLRFRTRGRSYRVRKGELLCYDSCIKWEQLPESSSFCSYYVADFELVARDGPKQSLTDIGFPFIFKTAGSPEIRKYVGKMYKTFQKPVEERGVRVSALGLQLFLALRASVLPETAVKAGSEPELHFRIREVLEYINANYKQRITLESLAEHIGMHPVYFSRVFKKQVGISPHRYILEFKIRKAKDFLLLYDEAAVYTGQELGFQDYSHFFRTFKRITGRTPIEYLRHSGKHYDPRKRLIPAFVLSFLFYLFSLHRI